MGRLEHIKQTLPRNLDLIKDRDASITLLDYNSKDGLEGYVFDHFAAEIESGKLRYFRERSREHFHMAHSKNMASRLSDGEFIINVDADTYLSEDYLRQLRAAIDDDCDTIGVGVVPKGVGFGGRIGTRRQFFMRLRGYDETFMGWGCEDIDFEQRMAVHGHVRKGIDFPDAKDVVIAHDDILRVENYPAEYRNTQVTFGQNLSDKKNPRRIVNKDGFGCGEVFDHNGLAVKLDNPPINLGIRQLATEDAYAEIFEEWRGKSVRFITAYGNVGDAMIHLATRQLFQHYGLTEVTGGWGLMVDGTPEALVDRKTINPQPSTSPDVVMYGGGGNIGLYDWDVQRQDIARGAARAANAPLIVLPQTWGDTGTFEGASKIFVRDRESVAISGGGTLMPDMAFALKIPPHLNHCPVFPEGVFMRVDKEGTGYPNINVCDPSAWTGDVVSFLTLAGMYQVIHTNRLHFAIAGLLLNRDVVLYPNSYRKNRSMFDAWLRDAGCHWRSKQNFPDPRQQGRAA